MKKIAAIIISLCFCIGVLGDAKYTVSSKETPENHIEETDSYSQSQKEQLKNTNCVFSEKDPKDTPFEGQKVEVIEGELYVNGRTIWTIRIWTLSKGIPILIGWMAAGGIVKQATNKIIKTGLINKVKFAWNKYSNITDVYADEQQNLQSAELSNGNQCALASSGNYKQEIKSKNRHLKKIRRSLRKKSWGILSKK